MGRATIVANMGEGRYTIEIDFGKDQQTAIVANLSAQILKLDLKIVDQQVIVAQADAEEAAQRAKTAAAQAAFIAEFAALPPGAPPPDQGPYQFELMALYKMRSLNRPKRSLLDSLKQARTNAGAKLASVQDVVTIERRNAWCVDYTLTATGVVATLEVPGEQGLILIQPGGRAYVGSDGTMLLSDKVAIIVKLGEERDACAAKLTVVNDKLATAKVSRTAAAAVLKAKTDAFITAPTDLALAEVNAAQDVYDEKNAAVVALEAQARALNQAIIDYQKRIAYWAEQPASESPQYGDGSLIARELLSPEQAYWNVSVLPGWQKHKPMFRTGVLTAVNFDADIGTVDLDNAVSSAQALNVNARQTLTDIPVRYMDCNASAFDVGDRVVVQFGTEGWDDATVIGFVDTPQQCCVTEALLTFAAGVPYSESVPMYIPVPGYASQRVPCGECGGVSYPIFQLDSTFVVPTQRFGYDLTYQIPYGACSAIMTLNGEMRYCSVHFSGTKLVNVNFEPAYTTLTGCVVVVSSSSVDPITNIADSMSCGIDESFITLFTTPHYEMPPIKYEVLLDYSIFDGETFLAKVYFGNNLWARMTILIEGQVPEADVNRRVGRLVKCEVLVEEP